MTLAEAARGKETDKFSGHSYLPFYDRMFAHLRQRSDSVLEVGVAAGGSLRMWGEWFEHSPIVGIDIWPMIPIGARFRLICGDAYTAEMEQRLYEHAPYSVIIDDGPHTLASQKFFCANYPQYLVHDGFAVVEDVQTDAAIPELAASLPRGFDGAAVDLRHVANRADDLLFLIWKT